MKSIFPILLLVACCACGPRRGVLHTAGQPYTIVDTPPAPPGPTENLPVTATAHTDAVDDVAPAPTIKPRRTAGAVITELNGQLADAFFPYDRSEVTPEALSALRADAALLLPILAEFPSLRLVVEGHCDERGSAEYNIGLGDRRAARAHAVLTQYGIPAQRLDTVSYGKEMPQCTDPAESCWWRNRRAHVRLAQP